MAAGEVRNTVTNGGTTQPGYEEDAPATDPSTGNAAVQGQLSSALSGDNGEKNDGFGVSSTAERNANRKHVDDDKTSVLGNTSNILTAKEESSETSGTSGEEPSGTAAASLELTNSMQYNDKSLDY